MKQPREYRPVTRSIDGILTPEQQHATATRGLAEQAVRQVARVDVSGMRPLAQATPEAKRHDEPFIVRHRTFESAQANPRDWSRFVAHATTSGNWLGAKRYLDSVEATADDQEIIQAPEQIAALYGATTRMVADSFKLYVQAGVVGEHTRHEAKAFREHFTRDIVATIPHTSEQIVRWCHQWDTPDTMLRPMKFPVSAVEYRTPHRIQGVDVVDAGESLPPGVQPNMRVQRQMGGQFVMAYSQQQLQERFGGQRRPIDKRIYLNPQLAAAPEIFTEVLQRADEAQLSLQMKLFQRAPELSAAYAREQGGATRSQIRGDGIVLYVGESEANAALAVVLDVAERHSAAFAGRRAARIPQMVASGIAVGDEPRGSGESLTSHRAQLLDGIIADMRALGAGDGATDVFMRLLRERCAEHGIDPHNIAFND